MQKFVFTFLFSLPAFLAFSQDEALRKRHFNTDQGLAIGGYDPVAYFTRNKAVKGSKEFAVSDQGVTYYFSSAADKEEFKKNPAHYEPQYGGWCAYAMGKDGAKVEVDPGTFKIVDGKLFLFYNHFFTNTLKTWNKDEANLHHQADANWQKTWR
jgi:YHS domain-containing protein